MMPNTTFPINKVPSYYTCCKCTTKPADYYVLTGANPKSPTEMIPLCDLCYYHHHQQQHNSIRRNNRRWYYHPHRWNGEARTMPVAYVNTMLISYVLEALPPSAQIVKPAMLESLGMKHLKSWENRERKIVSNTFTPLAVFIVPSVGTCHGKQNRIFYGNRRDW